MYIFAVLVVVLAFAAVIATIIAMYSYANAYLYNSNNSNNTEPHVHFMTSNETAHFFAEDRDRYVRNMSPLDLHARNVKTPAEYINKIKDTAISFTDDEKDLLRQCVKDADIYLRNEVFSELEYGKHLNGGAIADIKWIFANTYTKYELDVIKENEQGLPHTREDIILLSKNVLKYDALNLTNTLIHEKIHIYQRYNPAIFDTIIKEMGLKELDKRVFKQAKYIRSNPDTNNKIYYYPETGKDADTYDIENVMVCLYRNDKPNSINDVIQRNYAAEHPYEKIAYEIGENFNKNNKNKYINIK